MAQTMYRWYQQTGGEDEWQPIQASEPLDDIKPTFVTILACDTLIDKTTPREVLVKAKYQGPMYFDLDDKEDVSNSIGDAQKLYEKLLSHDLQEQDIQIFLSGKKGLHLIVPEACFMSKPMPQVGLVAMYKEMAFKLAVDTMDFRVYTAKRGRQFRTCYNVRENGNYKVQISAAELSTLTPEIYQELCKEPRPMLPLNPQWRGKFALLYDQAYQKITKLKPKPVKPVQPAVLKEQLPLFERLASGKVKTVSGFNVIAMQLCLYAREAGWTEDQLIEQCQGLIENHQSDGSRYNTKWRRAAELRRMFWYLDDNPSFEYSVKGIRACMAKEAQVESEDEPDQDGEQTVDTNFGGVYRGVTAYMAAKGDDGDIPITNFVGKDVIVYRSAENGLITSIAPIVSVQGKKGARLAIAPSIFTGGASLQNTVAAYGGAFSGTDVHARGIYQAMLKEVTTNCYVTTVEGLSVLKLGTGSKERTEHVVWADREGIRANDDFSALGGNLVFEGDPDPRGLFKTDLLAAPDLPTFLAEEGNAERLTGTLQALFNAHTPESMGKIVGWAVAAYYAPLFQAVHHKFPLLHIYGPAGSGKTELSRGILRLFYHRADPLETTPNSSVFALQHMAAGSASIPLLIDEYKPHVMNTDKLNALRALLRDLYNAKEVQRGGGNKSAKDNFNALSSLRMQAPVMFVAEAAETETAIVERSVMVSFKRLSGRQQAEAYRSALAYYRDTEPMASLGIEIANRIVAENNPRQSLVEFDRLLTWANNKFLPAPDDYEKVKQGLMTEDEMRLRSVMRPRNIFNATVSAFGLKVLKGILIQYLGEDTFAALFADKFNEMARSVFLGMDKLAVATLPEYVKTLVVMSDMSKLASGDPHQLVEGVDYNLSEYAERMVLVLAVSQAYRKYRIFVKAQGLPPLYPSEEAFRIALTDIPQFLKLGTKTQFLEATTVVLDVEELTKAGVPIYRGKAASLDL